MNNIDLVCTESLDAFPPYSDPAIPTNPDHPTNPTHLPNTTPPAPSAPNLNFPAHALPPPSDKVALSSPMTWSESSPDHLSSATTSPVDSLSCPDTITTDDDESGGEDVLAHHPVQHPIPQHSRHVAPQPAPDAHAVAGAHATVLADLSVRDRNYAVPHTHHLRNTGITPAMRCEVVSWFSDLVADLAMPEAAVAVATNIFDRFLAVCRVDPVLIFAISSACFLISCKVILDEDVSNYDVAERTRVSLEHLNTMESLILTELGWAVNVVTPHEALAEVDHLIEMDPLDRPRVRHLQSSLVMAAMVDYELMHLRATAVGIACHVLSAIVLTDVPVNEFDTLPGYLLASSCGVPMAEVDFCLTRMRNTLATTLGFIEDCETDTSMDESEGGRDEGEETGPFAAEM